MDYSKKSRKELIAICKEKKIKGYSGKKKEEIINLLPKNSIEFSEEKTYLETIRSQNKQGYKRVSVSPLRYAGGKSNAVGLILEHFPVLKSKKVISPFFGGGSFEIVLSKHLGYEVIGYDIFGMLVNFWKHAISCPEDLANELVKLVPDQTNFTRNRHILLHYWETIKPSELHYTTKNRLELTDSEKTMLSNSQLLQAAYYYYNMQLSYGPMFLGWQSSVYLKQDRYDSIVERIRTFKPGNIRVECNSFENVIRNHPDDFLFLDPPYYLGNDSKMFKGIYPNSNFAIHHDSFNHKMLCDLLKQHRGGFFITYNDCPTIREWYKEYKQEFPKWQYTYGQGETRIGKNRTDGNTTKESHEIFIICPPPQ